MANALDNFNESHWAAVIENSNREISSLRNHSDFQYEKPMHNAKEVIVRFASTPTVGDYTVGQDITIEQASGDVVTVPLEKQSYFAFTVDDVEAAKMTPDLLNPTLQEALKKMRIEQDTYVGEKLKGALGAKNKSAAAIDVTENALKAEIKAARTYLATYGDVPQSQEVYLEVTPEVYYELVDFLSKIKTDNDELLKNGALAKYLNAYVTMETALPAASSTSKYCFVRTKKALAFYETLRKIRKVELEKQFSNSIQALFLYGAKVVRPKELYGIEVKATIDAGTSTDTETTDSTETTEGTE